uniref:Ubiquitin-like protease family profile domain-containing protein n=1 Tax=Lactuca sativa TaxID=4236 RepID=A0A9R1VSW7_LACSA|nr:hypothetical protein LSAT_V11C400194670 [Lactuca sativa]
MECKKDEIILFVIGKNFIVWLENHDYNNFNVKAIVNLKGSRCNIRERYGIWLLVGRPSFTRKRIVVPQNVSPSDTVGRCFISRIKRLYFRVGDMKMVYGPEEFCLITGLNFGEYLENIGKKRLFPNYTNSSVKIGDLKKVDDADAVRICLIYILCEGFLGKEINDRIWIYEMLPAVRACGFGQPPRQNMLPSDGDMTSCYYMSFQEYVYGERKSVPFLVRDHFRRQDEFSSSMSSSGRSHGRGERSEKHNLEVLKRLHALEQHVFTNREPREVFVEEVNNEDLWNNISFEEPAVFQTKFDERELEERNNNAGKKFDDDVFDVNDYNKAKEEDEVIITGNVDYYDAYGFVGKEVTPDTEDLKTITIFLHTTLNPVPPPAFAVVHDFSVLRLQPYVAGGEVVIHNYLFHSYDVQHRLFNFVLDKDFWSALFGHTHDGWLESSRRFKGDQHTIMPSNFFVCHALEEGQNLRAFMASIATYPNFMVAWWDVDTVLLPIHSSPNHWLFRELRLASMEVHIYDSLGRVAYEKLNSNGTYTKFESRVANYLDKINYWAPRNILRIPLNMQFILKKKMFPNKVVIWEIVVFLFVCLWNN